MQPLRGPTAEAYSNRRLHTVAKGDNHVEIVVANLSLHLTLAFLTLGS